MRIWHAEGQLSDGDMMQIDSRTTDAVRRRPTMWTRWTRWTTEIGITSASGTALAKVDGEDANAFAIRGDGRVVGSTSLRFDLGVHGVSCGQESELTIVWLANDIRAACHCPRVRRYVGWHRYVPVHRA
ncbi:hypothetical protein [Streptomyces sp. NPDC127033]|uniref:hypothetical protein n=1 Tax=Streptomyces sp. NPDC127033 TaxID=3347110 RepID=UPI00364FF4B8